MAPSAPSWPEDLARGDVCKSSSGDRPRSYSSTAPPPPAAAWDAAPHPQDSPPLGPRGAAVASSGDVAPPGCLEEPGGPRRAGSGDAPLPPPANDLAEPPLAPRLRPTSQLDPVPASPFASPLSRKAGKKSKRDKSPKGKAAKEADAIPVAAAVASPLTPSASPRVAAVVQAEAALALLADEEDEESPVQSPTKQQQAQLEVNEFATGSGFETFREAARPRLVDVQSLVAFPDDVEVSFSTRKLLLTWARWGRNSLRITQEQQLKAMQHMRHPRTAPPRPRTPITSPQATPRSTPRGTDENQMGDNASVMNASSSSTFSPGLLRATARQQGLMTSSRAEPWMSRNKDDDEPLFSTMREEQRNSMEQQGVKNKMCRHFGADAAVAKSNGTPGFGVETPGFGAGVGSSRVSAQASVAASVMSSGISSPLANGQLSPWILEAEALLNEDDEDLMSPVCRSNPAAWGAPPSEIETLESQLLIGLPSPMHHDLGLGSFGEEILETIQDVDELEKVDLFVNASTTAPTTCGNSPGASSETGSKSDRAGDDNRPLPLRALSSDQVAEGLQKLCKAEASGGARPAEQVYQPGEAVRYWSASRSIWMPARVVERRSRGVYLIDKQMRGCLGKVQASELISEAEERSNPVLRAVAALGLDDSEDEEAKPKSGRSRGNKRGSDKSGVKTPVSSKKNNWGVTPPSAASPRVERSSGPGDGATNATPSPARPTTPPHLRGKIMRDDFSSDSEEEAPQQPLTPVMSRGQDAVGSPLVSPAVTSPAFRQAETSSPASGSRGGRGRGRGGRGRGGTPLSPTSPTLDRSGRNVMATRSPRSANRPARPTTPPLVPTGRVLRDDFSEDSDR